MSSEKTFRRPNQGVDSDELPIVLEEGGSTAGEKHVSIRDGECGNCGYDRIRVSRQFGEAYQKCMLCDAGRHGSGDEWTLPTTDAQLQRELRSDAANEDYTTEALGGNGPRRADVFTHDTTDIYKLFDQDGTMHAFVGDDLRDLLLDMEAGEGFLTDLINDDEREFEGMQVRPEARDAHNPNARHIGDLMYDIDRNDVLLSLVNQMRHHGAAMPPLHIPAKADGVAP